MIIEMMQEEITLDTPLYLYRFQYDGACKQDLCRIISLTTIVKEDRIAFETADDRKRFYIDYDDLNAKATMGATICTVLTKPDIDLAKNLAVEAIDSSIERKEKELDRMKAHRDRLLDTCL